MKALYGLAAFLMLTMGATVARGDGGAMLLHQDAGAFTITLFAAPQPLRIGDADLSVMVQDRTSGRILLDPTVDVTVDRAADANQQTVRLAKNLTNNRLLLAGTVHFSAAGKWHLTVAVRRSNDTAQLSTECAVEPGNSRIGLVWFYVLLPVAVVSLFVLHQILKIRSEGKVP